MALVGSDAVAGLVKGEALLVTGVHHSRQLLSRHRATVVGESRQKDPDVHPPGLIKGDPDDAGIMPQHQREELGGAPIVHLDSVPPGTSDPSPYGGYRSPSRVPGVS